MPTGQLLLVLHAHLPFIRHPEEDFFLEEDWLFEAITETYIPILERMTRLRNEGVRARLTMTWSPSLCEMLADPLLQQRYRRYLDRLLGLAEQEVPAKQGTEFAETAVMYRDHFAFCLQQMDRYNNCLLHWVRELVDANIIEAITCGATHGLLPLMKTVEAQRAQVGVAYHNFKKHFGREPKGIWLPECGYTHGLENILKEFGIRYFFVDTHGIYYGSPRPRNGVYAPVYCRNGVAAFGRDPESSRSVWSAECGYPGNAVHREFYRDLGYDGDYNYIKNFLHPDGVRRNLGLKYHKVTGEVELHEKQAYNPSAAFKQAMDDAGDFVNSRQQQANHLRSLLGRTPLIVSPYDAELFGHWWFEGPQFIESIMRTCDQDDAIRVINGLEYLEENPAAQVVQPGISSWGDNGYNGVWLNPENDWIYRHLHVAEERMRQCARLHPHADGLLERALKQMGRELLLAQSSDWAFIMTTGTSPSYATRRTKDHINRFTGLFHQVIEQTIDEGSLSTIEWHDTAFQEIDYRLWA